MIQIARAIGPRSRSTRSFISFAALFVNVIARISFGFDALRLEQVRDPVREHARLAGAGAGDHEQRAFGGEHGLALGGVQIGQIGLGLRCGHPVDRSRQVRASSSLSSHATAAPSVSDRPI